MHTIVLICICIPVHVLRSVPVQGTNCTPGTGTGVTLYRYPCTILCIQLYQLVQVTGTRVPVYKKCMHTKLYPNTGTLYRCVQFYGDHLVGCDLQLYTPILKNNCHGEFWGFRHNFVPWRKNSNFLYQPRRQELNHRNLPGMHSCVEL